MKSAAAENGGEESNIWLKVSYQAASHPAKSLSASRQSWRVMPSQ